jgi:hypothetical protein
MMYYISAVLTTLPEEFNNFNAISIKLNQCFYDHYDICEDIAGVEIELDILRPQQISDLENSALIDVNNCSALIDMTEYMEILKLLKGAAYITGHEQNKEFFNMFAYFMMLNYNERECYDMMTNGLHSIYDSTIISNLFTDYVPKKIERLAFSDCDIIFKN